MAASKKRSSAKKSGAKKGSGKKSSSAKKGSSTKTSARKKAAKRGGQKSAAKKQARKAASRTARAASRPAAAAEFSGKTVAEFRNALRKNLITPLEAIIISRKRIEEVMDEAVKRGRVTADDAQALVQGLVDRGRKQTNDVLGNLEELMGRGTGVATSARKRSASAAERARRQVDDATTSARKRARDAADPLLAQADRARRTVGVGPAFPIVGYDELSASQVQARLDTLTPAELRKVRDYERRHGNRKTVLSAIEQKLRTE